MKRFIYSVAFALFFVILSAASSYSLEAGGDIPVFSEADQAPYAGFLFDRTPDLMRVDQTPSAPIAGQAVRISAVVVQNKLRASLPVKKVSLFYSTGDEWTEIEMLQSDGDAEYYFAYIPPQPAGVKVQYYVQAEDNAGSKTTELASGAAPAIVVDADEDDSVVLPDIDIHSIEAGYEGRNLRIKLTLDGKPGKGNMAEQGAYIYFMPIFDVKSGMGTADLFNVPVLAYAPILSDYIGVESAGLYRVSDLLSTKSQIEGADVKFKKTDNTIMFQLSVDAITKDPEPVIGLTALTIAASSPENILPWEAAPFLTIVMRSHEYEVTAEPPVVSFRAGYGENEITPPVGTPLAGYGDRKGVSSTGVHDPLMAQALILEAGGEKFVIISSDFFYIRRPMLNDIGRMMETELNIPRDHLIISAQHSHSTSGGMFPELVILGGKVVPGLYEETVAKYFEAVKKADASYQDVKIGSGSVKAPGMNNNRRQNGGPVDDTLSVLKIETTQGDPLVFYYNFSAHPTMMGSSNLEFSAEFPGATRKHIAKMFPGAKAMFVNGSLGNMSPACPGDCGSGWDKVDSMGEKMAMLISDISNNITAVSEASFTFVSREILMHPQFGMWTNMAAMRIGDAALVSDPGEAYVELGFPVRDRANELGYKTCMILGITNDGIGYIIPEEWFNKHVYEATFALYGPTEGQFIQKMMLENLDAISGVTNDAVGLNR